MATRKTAPTRHRALITGASAGIGRELAREFAANGYDLVVVARRRSRLASLKRELEADHGVLVRVVEADLFDPAAPAALRQTAVAAQPGSQIRQRTVPVPGY